MVNRLLRRRAQEQEQQATEQPRTVPTECRVLFRYEGANEAVVGTHTLNNGDQAWLGQGVAASLPGTVLEYEASAVPSIEEQQALLADPFADSENLPGFVCDICGLRWAKSRSLHMHRINAHPATPRPKAEPKPKKPKKKDPMPPKPMKPRRDRHTAKSYIHAVVKWEAAMEEYSKQMNRWKARQVRAKQPKGAKRK